MEEVLSSGRSSLINERFPNLELNCYPALCVCFVLMISYHLC